MAQTFDEKLCLQWNDFQHTLETYFRALRDDKEFTDVTLACKDGQQLKAHKVVLASSSPFFKGLLQGNKHPHPLIYMRGVKSDVLVAMMDFLYHGEANIYQENLNSFLVIAEELQLKGLHGNGTDETPETNPSNNRPRNHDNQTTSILPKEKVNLPYANSPPFPNLRKPKTEFNLVKNPDTAIALDLNSDFTDSHELSEKVKSMMLFSENTAPGGKTGKARICTMCGKEGRCQATIDHIEANHITGIALPCNICGKVCPSRYSLRMHKIRMHKQ